MCRRPDVAAVDVAAARGVRSSLPGSAAHVRCHAFAWLLLVDSASALGEIDRISRDLAHRAPSASIDQVGRMARALDQLGAVRAVHVRRLRDRAKRLKAPVAARPPVPAWIDKAYAPGAWRAPAAVRHRMNRRTRT